jgi:hypothetical protein
MSVTIMKKNDISAITALNHATLRALEEVDDRELSI